MLSRVLRQTLFSLVHLVASILVAVQNVYHRFWRKNHKISDCTVTKDDLKMIIDYVPRMSKRLKYLVVMVDIDKQSLNDLARMVIWSLVSGIPHFSFYDITGVLSKNEDKLYCEVEKMKKGIAGCLKWANRSDINGYTNGIPAHTMRVSMLTREDGRPKIAECIKEIAQNKIPCRRKSSQFTAQELNEALSIKYAFIPDPDLVLYTGKQCCVHGLLPWHIRLSEFVQMSVDHSVNIQQFVGALIKYDKCDQRFGK